MESLLTGEVNIYHIAMLNDALAARAENARRAARKH
jgi:hypothetical protein